MPIARVQDASGSSTASISVSATWGSTTTSGNLLVAALAASLAAATAPVIHLPTGWVLAASLTTGTGGPWVWIYYIQNCGARSGAESFSRDPPVNDAMTLVIAEYSGLAISGVLDKNANNSGASSSPDTGTTGTTTSASELWYGGVSQLGSGLFSAPTNSFSIRQQIGAGATLKGCGLERIVSSTGTADCSVTSTQSGAWAGAIQTFNAAIPAPVGGQVLVNQSVKRASSY